MGKMIKKTVWIVLEAKMGRASYNKGKVESVSAATILNNKPTVATKGVVMELEMELDEEMFQPIAPKVVLTIAHDPPAAVAHVTGKRVRSTAAQKVVP